MLYLKMENKQLKHTPAPWAYSGGDNNGVDIVLPNNATISISRESRYFEGFVMERDEMEANAKLIAAAPELLNELLTIVSEIENSEYWWMDSPGKGGFDLERIKNTIKKATE